MFVGGFVGGVCGFFSGGGTTLAFVVASVAFEGATRPSLLSPSMRSLAPSFIRSPCAFLGAIWPVLRRQTRRLTIARLMGLIALVGLSLTPFLAARWLGVLVLTNTLIVLPVVIAALVAVDKIAARSLDPCRINAYRACKLPACPMEQKVTTEKKNLKKTREDPHSTGQ